jgi:hypothetical protein
MHGQGWGKLGDNGFSCYHFTTFFQEELIIDPHPVSSYNTFMLSIFNYFAGFFRPDHDPPLADLQTV